MAQHLDSRWYRIPAPLVPRVPTKPRCESALKKFEPHFICDCFFIGLVEEDDEPPPNPWARSSGKGPKPKADVPIWEREVMSTVRLLAVCRAE